MPKSAFILQTYSIHESDSVCCVEGSLSVRVDYEDGCQHAVSPWGLGVY